MSARIAVNAAILATLAATIVIAHQVWAISLKQRELSCLEAARLAHAQGFRSIEALSCSAPYAFSAMLENCSFILHIPAKGGLTAIRTDCDSEAEIAELSR